MSTRAISDYLEQVHQVNISAATIAKALREPGKHLAFLIDSIEPAARVVADALEIEISDLLANEDLFDASASGAPSVWGNCEEEIGDSIHAYEYARHHLKDSWYPINATVRAMALAEMARIEKEEANSSDE